MEVGHKSRGVSLNSPGEGTEKTGNWVHPGWSFARRLREKDRLTDLVVGSRVTYRKWGGGTVQLITG